MFFIAINISNCLILKTNRYDDLLHHYIIKPASLKSSKTKATVNVVPNALILKVSIGTGRVKHVALVSGASGADTQQQLAGQPRLDAPPAVMCRDLKPGLHILKRVCCDSFHFDK